MASPPVVDHDRLSRISLAPEKQNIGNIAGLVITCLVLMFLYKRYKDIQAKRVSS
jgi:hypothetical protein